MLEQSSDTLRADLAGKIESIDSRAGKEHGVMLATLKEMAQANSEQHGALRRDLLMLLAIIESSSNAEPREPPKK